MTLQSAEARFFFEAPVEHVDTGTARIAVRRWGRGEPLLFIHGWPFSGFIYRKLIAKLAPQYSCYAVDLPGAGASQWRKGNDFSFHGHADHLVALARAVGLDGYRIIAHDTGATVARRLAILEGDRVRQLVLIDTEIPNHRPPLVPFFQKVLAVPGSNFVFRRLLRSRRFLRSSMGFGGCFVDMNLLDGELHDEIVAPLIASKERMTGQILYARGIDWGQLDALAEGHAQIKGNVLLVWGDQDPFFPIERAREMIPQFARCAGLVEIKGTKLLPHDEKVDEVLQHVRAFFAVA